MIVCNRYQNNKNYDAKPACFEISALKRKSKRNLMCSFLKGQKHEIFLRLNQNLLGLKELI
jgi:hypothetical protein